MQRTTTHAPSSDLGPSCSARLRGRRPPALPTAAALLVCLAAAAASASDPIDKVDPWVLDAARRFGTSEFLVFLSEQGSFEGASGRRVGTVGRRALIDELQRTARQTQEPLLAELEARGIEHRSFWIANMIWARGDRELIYELAARKDVSRLLANPRVKLDRERPGTSFKSTAASTIEWGVRRTRAHTEFWRQGFDGQGVVIGGQDTGYDWRHPALLGRYRGWSAGIAVHDYNWHDAIHSGGGSCGPDSREPCDDGSHGTHTMGTMVGDDGGANRIGLAPGARWIGCRNMDQGVGTPATYAECFEWFMAPTDLDGNNPDPDRAPDIISNSWTCPPSEGCTSPDALLTVVRNVRAAGILVVASAGNGGPACSTVSSPIAVYDEVLTVGASDSEDDIASFSSRGPVSADGSNRLKPDLVAPGVDVRSSVPGGAYAVASGTSMASPHVAGMAALVLSAAECLRSRPDDLERHLLSTARPRSARDSCGEDTVEEVPNLTFGHGILDGVLPACPGDGRVAGRVTRLATSRVVCRNRTQRLKTNIARDRSSAWSCTASGLEAATDDRLVLKVTGKLLASGSLTVAVDGIDTRRVVCANRSSSQRVSVTDPIGNYADCQQHGLAVAPGDRIKLTVVGTALNDSKARLGSLR